jgi:hypothetical protein
VLPTKVLMDNIMETRMPAGHLLVAMINMVIATSMYGRMPRVRVFRKRNEEYASRRQRLLGEEFRSQVVSTSSNTSL